MNSTADVPNDQPIFLSIPYFGPYSEKLKNEILLLISKYYAKASFRIILTNKFTIGSFFNYKNKLPLHMCSSLVYKFCCVQCTSEYVGMTTRTLGIRVDEHKGVSFRTGVRLTSPPHSAVREHSKSCGAAVDIDSFRVLSTSSYELDLRILESLFIFKIKPDLNNQLSSYPLSIVKP